MYNIYICTENTVTSHGGKSHQFIDEMTRDMSNSRGVQDSREPQEDPARRCCFPWRSFSFRSHGAGLDDFKTK